MLFLCVVVHGNVEPLGARFKDWADDLQRAIALRELDNPPAPVDHEALAAWHAQGREAAERRRCRDPRPRELNATLQDIASWLGGARRLPAEVQAAHDAHVATLKELADAPFRGVVPSFAF